MKLKNKKRNKGFTLVEVLVTVFIFSIVFTAILSALSFGLRIVAQSRNKAMANAIANQELEKIRNISYSLVGISGGFPDGSLSPSETITQNGVDFVINRKIVYVVDEADGVADPEDECPNDYKKVSVKISWQGRYSGEVNFSTDIMPETLSDECSVVGGVLSVSVLNDHGDMINSPTIEIKNPLTKENIITANPESGQHYFSLPAGEYKVVVFKDGYSTEQTFASNELYNGKNIISPEKANPNVIDKKMIPQSFIINELGSFDIKTTGPAALEYPVVGGASILIHGNKKVGTDADGKAIYKYFETKTTNGVGSLTLSDIDSDLYSFSSTTSGLDIVSFESPYGNAINQPVNLLPTETNNLRIILEAQNSLLVIVKTADTELPVFSASARVYNSDLTYDQTLYTDELGRAYFIPMSSGNYKIDISAAGYIALPGTPITVSGGSNKSISIVQE